MAIIVRPLSRWGVRHKRFAERLGRGLLAAPQGSVNRIFDGLLFRAVRTAKGAEVLIIDPAAVWAFLHYEFLPGVSAFMLATRAYNRDQLMPGVQIEEPVAMGLETALLRFRPGGGYFGSIDTGALGLVENRPPVPMVTPDAVSVYTEGAVTGAADPTFASDRYQVIAQVFGVEPARWFAPDQDTGEFVGKYSMMRDWYLPEAGLVSATGDSHARLRARRTARFLFSIPFFGAQSTAEGLASDSEESLWYSDPICAGAYASQPTGADIAPPVNDPAWLSQAGTFITRLRRPEEPAGNFYPLSHVGTIARKMTQNPEPELVPPQVTNDLGVTRYGVHGVAGVALCYVLGDEEASEPADGGGARGTAHLFSCVYCQQGGSIWVALQRQSLLPNGSAANGTLYKSTDQATFVLGHKMRMFEVDGVYGVRVPTTGGASGSSAVDLVHLGVDDVLRTTGLKDAGWYAFTPYAGSAVGKGDGSLFGQAPVTVADIGDGKLAVIARDYLVTTSAELVDWHLVIIDAVTGAFVEDRGLIGSLLPFRYLAYLAVVAPESTRDDVTTPAVLMCSLGGICRISADGGRTWVVAFTGFRGYPLYLGNQLRKIRYGERV